MSDKASRLGVVLRAWVTASASRERIGRLVDGRIRAYVSPPPERGKANTRLIALLAKLLRVPRDSIEILTGARHPQKLVRVAGCSEADVDERIPRFRSGHFVGAASVRSRARDARVTKKARAAGTRSGT